MPCTSFIRNSNHENAVQPHKISAIAHSAHTAMAGNVGNLSQQIGQMCELQVTHHKLSIDSFLIADIDKYSVALLRVLFDKRWRELHQVPTFESCFIQISFC
jgi:hypothetical protein